LKPFKYFKHYEIIFEETITSPNKCLFGVHPHSVFGLSLLSLMNSMKEGPLSNMVGLSSRFILNFPITGAFLKLWGIEAVNHTNIKRLMSNGKNIGILPGGFEEATITSAEEMRCWIENRKGFIKYALDFGYTIYPVMMMN
jgi:2-acylglycerol O-acyltransferase 2